MLIRVSPAAPNERHRYSRRLLGDENKASLLPCFRELRVFVITAAVIAGRRALRYDDDDLEERSVKQLTMDELEAGLEQILSASKHSGVLELIVRRPRPGERE